MPLFFSIFKENKEKGEKKEKKIRIPKVPVVVSEEQEEEIDFFQIEKEMGIEKEKVKVRWINLEKFLFDAGIVFLSGELNRKKGKIILGLIIYIAIVHPIRELHLFLNNCVSGCLRTAITMHDAIQQLPRPGHTVGCGMNASVGSLILVSGHERLAQPHARIIIQKPEWIKRKNPNKRKKIENPKIRKIENPKIKNPKRKNLRRYFDDYAVKKQFDILTEYVHEIFVEKTGQPYDIIQKDLQENVVMSAKEAQDYGIIDRLTTDFKMQSLLHETLLRNRNDNFEENRDDTPGWG
jgi:ATP-dependent Clp protease protease subunit